MEKKTSKKLLAILMIITILTADFFVLGSNLITYATQLNSETNNSNVEFSAYFKNGENKVDTITSSIKDENLRLYAEIKVNSNDGYLKEGTTIEIENSNFNLKSEILSSNKHIASIEKNKVNLKQINNGETVEIELGIEPIVTETITTDFLSKISTVKMNGTYIYSQAEDGTTVSAEKEVCVNYQPDETTESELDAEIITNKLLAINGTNKRAVQLLVKSRLTNNEYPVEQTTLKVSIPKLAETTPEISVMAIDELATNGLTEISTESYTSDGENIQIVLKNEANSEQQISWKKKAYDEVVITYLYPEDASATSVSISVTSQIKAYGITEPYTNNITCGINNQELCEVIIGKTEIATEEMYKGQIYANIDTQYDTKTSIIVTNENVVDKVVLNEQANTFGTAESELAVNTKYVTTEIDLEKMLAILGQDGSIEIKNGEITTSINKNSTVNENGNVVITHGNNSTAELVITTSKPLTKGVLEINHTKVITGNTYTREQLQAVTTLKAKGSIIGTTTIQEQEFTVVQNPTKISNSSIELKETISKAELIIDKTTLSTTEANEVTVGIKLITDGVKYDLYENPTITLKMPAAVENVEFLEEPSKVYADEFATISKNYDATNNVVSVSMTGEQTTYPESSLQQAYIQLKLKVTLNSLALAQTDKITMEYKNENAFQYEDGITTHGVAEQVVEISAPSELIKRFNISSNENTSLTETILQKIKEDEAGKTFDFLIELINNRDSDISNVKILGKLPTTGNTITEQDENTLETTLTNILADNATVYYTENVDATADIENKTNGWTQDLATLTNAKLYLIKLDSLARGTNYTATVTVQIPNPLTENALSYTGYEVIYDTGTATGISDNSRKIGLATSIAASIGITTTAQVGQDILENGDSVKEGEVIKYTVTVKNNGTQTLQNVQLNLDVPEGTVYVRPIPREVSEDGTIVDGTGFVYSSGKYYEEITDSEKVSELTAITIPEITTTNPYTIQYEVRVNKGAADTEILNKTEAIYDETTIECEELKNTIKESSIRVTAMRTVDESVQLLPNGLAEYEVIIENLSNSTINNLEMQITAEGFNIEKINDEKQSSSNIKISEIKPKDENNEEDSESGMIAVRLLGKINKDAEKISISAIVKDSEGEKYRSNLLTEILPIVGGTINISSPQNGKVVKEGDTIQYNITVKNTSSLEGTLLIKGKISEYLKVQSIIENGSIKKEGKNISSEIYYPINLKPQEQAQIDIYANVEYIPELYHGNIITNVATVEILGVLEVSSEMMTHILKANTLQDEKIENVISGFAWFDENGNGQKDVDEQTLSGINVKLYNIKTNYYVKDEYGDLVQTETGDNGEYSFAKIPDGSYLIIFEYDAEKYEFTKALAEGVDTSLNSKASLKYINTEKQQIRVAGIELNNLNENVFNMNIGLKENTGETSEEQQPGITDNPINPENPDNPENPTNPENPGEVEETKTISGFAWLDSNRNGQKDENEGTLSGIKVKIYNVATKKYLTDSNGNTIETTTDNEGKYEFNNVKKGSYILIFEYDTEEYEPTTYMAEGVGTTKNSKAILNKININGQEMTLAVTDTINVQDDVSNINIGLKEKLIFDLELNKYISRIVVQNNKGTKVYDYDEKSLAKVEIHKKQLQGSLVVIEYTIKIRNNGEISGYAKNIVDYLPNGLTFSSELNSDWYLADNNLFTKSLENVELKPGEEKEIKLILTKTMTNQNTGLINNRAEIYKDYNKYGEADIDSTPNNQIQNEDDMSSVDIIIGISTGGSIATYVILLMINMILIGIAISLMIKNNIIKVSINWGRR